MVANFILSIANKQQKGLMHMKQLANNLKILRQIRGLTLRDVERGSGVSNPLLCQLENNHRKNPSISTIQKLASFYGVTIEHLLNARLELKIEKTEQ